MHTWSEKVITPWTQTSYRINDKDKWQGYTEDKDKWQKNERTGIRPHTYHGPGIELLHDTEVDIAKQLVMLLHHSGCNEVGKSVRKKKLERKHGILFTELWWILQVDHRRTNLKENSHTFHSFVLSKIGIEIKIDIVLLLHSIVKNSW